MWVWTSMLLMLLPALLAGRVLRIAPVAGEDRRKLLHDVGEVEGFPVQLVLALVADPEERVLLVGQATALEDQADGVRGPLRRMGCVRREEEDLAFADGDVVGLAMLDDSQNDVALDLKEEFLALVDVIIGAGIGATDHRHHEVAVSFPDLRITDGRLQQVAVLVDPFTKVERRELHGSLHGGDALQLDGDGRREAGDLHRRAAGRIPCEVFRPEAVVGREVALHVGEEHRHVDEPFPAEPDSSRILRTLSKTARHCASMSWEATEPSGARRTPGISFEPFVRGPIPERKRRFPTLRAWGKWPMASGARVATIPALIASRRRSSARRRSGARRGRPRAPSRTPSCRRTGFADRG